MNDEEFAQLSAGAALHSLSDRDRRRFERERSQDPEREKIATTDAETAALLADAAAPVAPPAHLREHLMTQIAATPPQAASTSTTSERPLRRSASLWVLAAVTVLVAATALGSLWATQFFAPSAPVPSALQQIMDAPDARQTTMPIRGGGELIVHWSNSLSKAVVVSDGLASLPSDRSYELWLVRGQEAIPAGLLNLSAGASGTLLDASYRGGDVIAITVEAAGGSPTGLPTSKPIVAVPT